MDPQADPYEWLMRVFTDNQLRRIKHEAFKRRLPLREFLLRCVRGGQDDLPAPTNQSICDNPEGIEVLKYVVQPQGRGKAK